jgi:hypothetical protein
MSIIGPATARLFRELAAALDTASPWDGEETLRSFLLTLYSLPPEAPGRASILSELGGIAAGSLDPWGILARRLERRYLRIRFVQQELGKLDYHKALVGERFTDFVFKQMNFAIYRHMGIEDFEEFFLAGLQDFPPAFYSRSFHMDMPAIRSLLHQSYVREAAAYHLERESPLVLSVLRSLHSSLEFLPLLTRQEIQGELSLLLPGGDSPLRSADLSRATDLLFPPMAAILNRRAFTHRDGAKTELHLRPQENVLVGVFHPDNKAFTLPLIALDKEPSA